MEFFGEEKGAHERRQVCGFRVCLWTYLRFGNVDRDRGEVFKAGEEKPRDRGRRRRRRRRSQRATRHEDVIKRLQRTSPLAHFPNPIYTRRPKAHTYIRKPTPPSLQLFQPPRQVPPRRAFPIILNATRPIPLPRANQQVLRICRHCPIQRLLMVNRQALGHRRRGRTCTAWFGACRGDGERRGNVEAGA